MIYNPHPLLGVTFMVLQGECFQFIRDLSCEFRANISTFAIPHMVITPLANYAGGLSYCPHWFHKSTDTHRSGY